MLSVEVRAAKAFLLCDGANGAEIE